MLGNKLRSWMEAVRPKKKHQRKEKLKQNSVQNQYLVPNQGKTQTSFNSSNDLQQITMMAPSFHHRPEDNGANLSSPESAYSTGYSTDGTSPMGIPDYYGSKPGSNFFTTTLPNSENLPPEHTEEPHTYSSCLKKPQQVHFTKEPTPILKARENNGDLKTGKEYEQVGFSKNVTASSGPHLRTIEKIISSEITSPRQRNRIRTNPWVPVSPCHSNKQFYAQPEGQEFNVVRSPYSVRQNYKYPAFCSPRRFATHYESSSCSSLSSTSTHWDANLVRGSRENSDEEDFTLNEMMGKFDESYVYEKETDILSDSDPTDGEIDTDTGEECHAAEVSKELDFIDNDSYHELNSDYKARYNTGNCFYFTMDANLRTVKRSQKFDATHGKLSEKRRKSNHQKNSYKSRQYSRMNVKISNTAVLTCTRSAENTPISIRKTKHPVSKLALNDTLRRRSNSVSFSKDSIVTFDQRDREASKKYKQLIVEAESILNNIKITTNSPKRLAPANKRVEMLRTTESSPIKVEELKKNFNHISKIPPKPELYPIKRTPIPAHVSNTFSPILMRKQSDKSMTLKNVSFAKRDCGGTPSNSPLMQSKFSHKLSSPSRKSPKYKRKNKTSSKKYSKESVSSDTDTEVFSGPKSLEASFSCYSEPVKRKVYTSNSSTNVDRIRGTMGYGDCSSTSNLRQQAMFNTIANLKKNLEDQSASLKHSYNGK